MTTGKKLLSLVLSLVLVLSLLPGLTITASAIAYNEVAGPRTAGDLTSYIYGDFVTEGDLPSPFGHTNPWSAFDWLTDGETITLAYAGPCVATAGTDFEGMGEYGYLGTAKMPAGSGMGDLMMVLLNPTDQDLRVYFFNETENDVNVSFHIQSTSNAGFGAHSVASVTTPEGTTALDNLDSEDPGQNLSADFAFTLAPYEGTAPAQSYGDDGSGDSGRPEDPEEGKSPAGCFYISLTTQPNLGPDPSAGVIISNFFAGGDPNASATVTLEAPAHGSYTATAVVPNATTGEDETVTETVTAGGEDKSFSYLVANGFTLSASGDADYGFDYWQNGATIISYDSAISTRSFKDGDTVSAAYLPAGQTRAFDVGGTRYVSWSAAVAAAQASGAPIILVKDYTLAATAAEVTAKGDALAAGVLESSGGAINYIVPNGVKFLVPYNAQDTGAFADGPAFSVAAPGSAYKTLTVPSGVTMTVEGKLNVNACAYANNSTSFMGGAAGDYGFIDLSGTLNVASGGELRTYGYIAGPGRVNVNAGATSYEVLQMTDWGGGSNAMSWNNGADDNLEKAFYFSQYYVQNVESDYRVYSGAMAYVYGHLTANMGSIKVYANVPAGFIGAGDTLFTMNNGYIERRYDGSSDRITYDVNGDMDAKAITVDVLSIATVASEKWLLGLTNNMDIIASSGTTTLNYGYMVLPGTRIVVEDGAKVVIAPTAKVHIWRLDDWQNGYVGGSSNAGKKIVPIRYTVANGTTRVRTAPTTSGILEVYGTVEAYSNIFTTDNGGTVDDMVVRGTGTLINHPGTASSGLYILKSSKNFEQIQTQPVLSYMYGETDLSSFEEGTYYSKAPEVDAHGNGTYDSWYQWQVDYTLTDQNGDTIEYTDYAYNSDIDLDGTLIADGERYVITGVDSIKDADDNDLSSSVTYDGDVTVGGLAVNKNADIADGWEAIQFHGLDQNTKVALTVQSYDHRVVWNETLSSGTTQTSADYVIGSTAAYEWDHVYAATAAVDPVGGATASVVSNATKTVLNLTDITEDVEVNITASTDYHPVAVNVTYPDSTTAEYSINSTEVDGVWTANYAPEKPDDGYYVIDSVSLTNGDGVGVTNHQESLTLTGVVTDNVVANVTLAHKDYKITYNTDGPALPASFVNSGEEVSVSKTALGENYIFGDAVITTAGTAAELTATPTKLTITGVDKDLTLDVPVIAYDYVVTADGQLAYVKDGEDATFTLDAGYALNGAVVASGTASVSYTNPETSEGSATITVTGVASDVVVNVDKVAFDAIVTFKDDADNVLATKYYGAGSTITYTAVDEGAGGERYYVADAVSTGATLSFDTQTVSVTDVTGNSADVTVTLIPFTYKVTWNDGVETTYSYLTGSENSATYTAPDEGVGGERYIIQTGYGEHASGATNTYSYDKSQYTVANINADETVTLTLKPFTYKVVFTDQNDNVLKTQYADDSDSDVTISVGDSSIRYDVAGLDLTSDKNTIITAADITGTATANDGADFGEGVSRVTLTGIGSDVTTKLTVYEYDHKLYVVLNDVNGWSSETETHYVEGDTYTWTRPDGAAYTVESASATYGAVVTATTDTSATVDLSSATETTVELSITTKQTVERLYTNLSQFTNATKNTATIEVTDSAYGVFTVTCPRACVVAIDNGDGTYTRLPAVPTGEANKYEFSCPPNFSESISLVVAVKGDVNGDGLTNAMDAGRVKSASVSKFTLTGVALLAADVDGNGSVNAMDAGRVKSASISKFTFAW